MPQPALDKITLDTSNEDPRVLLGGMELEVIDSLGNAYTYAWCDQATLTDATLEEFPDPLTLQVFSRDGFGTLLFNQAEIYRNDSGDLLVKHTCEEPNKYWEGTWGLATFLGAIKDQLSFFPDVSLSDIELDDDLKRLTLLIPLAEGPAAQSLQATADIVKRIIREAEIALAGISWKPEYAKDERAFCQDVIAPLLRRMRFLSVRYTQGAREYGKDFTFSELTSFGVLRHFGLQAKAGDISGEVNSAIDELVGQADDAFKMPYYDIASTEPRYISTFIVAISGRFTSNAKEKIVHKIPRGVHGSLLFLDRESILELVDRFWKTG